MIEQSAYDSLAEKLESLELTDDESAVLNGLVAAAAAAKPEVSGFMKELGGFPVFSFNDVKCDVHPWIPVANRSTDREGVVINHEEQYSR